MNNRLLRGPGQCRKKLSIKIIKNEVGCRDDTVPKTGDTRRHCEVELTVCNNLPQPPSLHLVLGGGGGGGCGRLLHTVNSTSQCLLARCHPCILLHF